MAGCDETQIVTETKIQEVLKKVPVQKIATQIVEKGKIVEKLVTAAPTKPAQASFNWVYIANALGAVASVSTIASSNAGREKGVISKRIHEVDVCEL